jgi:hypothetical protein
MQEHRKQFSKERTKENNNWKCTNTHFENILNLNDKKFNVISRRMYFHLFFGDC